MNDQIKTKINELFAECIKNSKSIIVIPCSAESYGIGIGGNTNDLFTTMVSLIKDVKKGDERDPSKTLLYNIIMDAISINFTPKEIGEQVDHRIDKLIP